MSKVYVSLLLATISAYAQPQAGPAPAIRRTVRTVDGKTIEGQLLGEGMSDMQIRTDDKKIVLLRKDGANLRIVTSQADWPTYNGDPGGNRYSKLAQIDTSNVKNLGAKWMFALPNARTVENTPLVVKELCT